MVLTIFLLLFHMFGGHGLHVTSVPPSLPLAAGVLACTQANKTLEPHSQFKNPQKIM
jgi:hypothetical protein